MTSHPDPSVPELDPAQAERLKRARLVRLNTVDIPRLRALGWTLIVLAVLAHNVCNLQSAIVRAPDLLHAHSPASMRLVGALLS